MPVQRLSPWCCEPETFFIRASSLRAQKDGVGSIFKDLMMYMGTHVASQFIVRVGFGLETTVALLGCEPRCARSLFLALSSRSACARGLRPRDDGRLAGVRAEVRAVPLLGLVLSLCMCAWAWASRRRAPCWGASRGARGSSSWPCPRSACARGLGPRDDSRLAGVRAEVRGPRDGRRPVGARFEFHQLLPGLALALFLFTLALLVHVHVCAGLETAGALVLPSLCFCFLWLPLCMCAAWAWASRGRARGASRVARGYS